MNQVNLTGRITHDLQVKVTPTDKHVLDFQIAVRETKDITTFVKCQAWEKTADYINDYAVKGSNLAISGSLKTDRYKDKNGSNVEKTYVRISQAEILDHRKGDLEKTNEQLGTEPNPSMFGSYTEIKSEDLPFY